MYRIPYTVYSFEFMLILSQPTMEQNVHAEFYSYHFVKEQGKAIRNDTSKI